MYVHDLLSPARVALAVPAATKAELFEHLSLLLTADGSAGVSASQARDALTAREKLGSTGLGASIALPHGRVPGLAQAIGAFCTLARPIDFAAIDHKPVAMAFALLVPEHANNEHLKILAELASLFNDKSWREALMRAPTAEALYAHLTQPRVAATQDSKAPRSRSG